MRNKPAIPSRGLEEISPAQRLASNPAKQPAFHFRGYRRFARNSGRCAALTTSGAHRASSLERSARAGTGPVEMMALANTTTGEMGEAKAGREAYSFCPRAD